MDAIRSKGIGSNRYKNDICGHKGNSSLLGLLDSESAEQAFPTSCSVVHQTAPIFSKLLLVAK